MVSLKDYLAIIGKKECAKIEQIADKLHGQEIVHVNSVAVAGGVAELLNSLVPLADQLGIRMGWRFLPGTQSFFEITKRMHNALQGEKIKFSKDDFSLYHDVLEKTALFNHFDHHSLVVIHDPQAVGLIEHFPKRAQPWVWRCHVDLSSPYLPLWRKLRQWVQNYDAAIISHARYRRNDLKITQHIIPPAIDPLISKNRTLSDEERTRILRQHTKIDLTRPFIAQVSRFDKWKDPLGVIAIYRLLKPELPKLQLALLGDMASDDPEGPRIFEQVLSAKENDPDIHVLTARDDLLVNAVQTEAQVILQWSLKEGFGLTVSEALWKQTPVVARAVGGIPLQVLNGKTGFLCKNVSDAALACKRILTNPSLKARIGKAGRQHVKENFLITTLLLRELTVFEQIINQKKAVMPGSETSTSRRLQSARKIGYH